MVLEDYQKGGVLSTDYRSISLKSFQCISVSEIEKMSDEAQAQFNGTVVVDGVTWVATLGGIPADKAKYTVSGNDKEIARWQANTRTYSKLQLTESGLVVQKFIKVKSLRGKESEAIMAGLSGADLLEQAKALGLGQAVADAQVAQVNSFTDGEEKPEKFGEIKKQIGEAPVAGELVGFNRRFGSLQGFITSTDRCPKVVIRKENKMENGSIVLKSDCPADVKTAWINDKKKPEAKYIEKESNIKLVEGKPGAIKHVILSIPEGGDVPFSSVINGTIKAPTDVTKTSDKVRKILPVEVSFDLIWALFGGTIYEDKNVLGAEASAISVQTKLVEVEDTSAPEVNGVKAKKTVARSSFRMGPDAKRKAVVTEGNFFPKSVYETIPLMNLSEENSAKLNEALIAVVKDEKKYNELSVSSKQIVKYDPATNAATATFFAAGAANPGVSVAAFHDSEVKLSTINFPVREKTISKKDGKVSYKYVQNKIGDANGKGPENVDAYLEFLKNAGVTVDEIKAAIKATKTSSGSGTRNANNLTAQQYLAAKFGNNSKLVEFKQGNASLDEIDNLLTSMSRRA